MNLFKNVGEYYEELFPVISEQKVFFHEEAADYSAPVKYLRIGCGTGAFEHYLAKEGFDVTGIDASPELLESANRKRRSHLMSVRFFQMSTLEMSRYLGKGFYNIISILDNRLIFIHDKTLLEKFFYDCRQLLSQGGKLILSVTNFELYKSSEFNLPERESIRARLVSSVKNGYDGIPVLTQRIKTGNGKQLSVIDEEKIQLIKVQLLEEMAKKTDFSEIKFYSDFNHSPFKADSKNIVAVLKA